VFTSAFLHLTLLHLAFNMYALYLFGPLVERMYGHLEFAILYLLCAAGGSVLTILLQPEPGAAGASGAIFGLFGLVFVVARRHRIIATGRARALIGQAGGLLLINLVFTFVAPGISWTGHVGGLLVGGLLGFLLPPTGVATLGSLWQRPGARPAAPGVSAVVRAATYVGVAALLFAGGIYAVAVG
ncbi:MAG: rhomboid family intramembrane serine protease, partial [Chloroflexota bacterium]|nr:rhomboid family intramembrane serine protease [Chloroflexota bacterium]